VKLVLFCLVAGVFPASGETRWAPSAITLYTNFQQPAPAAVVQAMQDEVEAIMAPIGLRFEWRSLSAARGHEVSAELAVITFQGRCDAVEQTVHPRLSGALGWTHVSDGTILPFTDIACDRIREFVQRSLFIIDREDRQEVYGRALGRVLAHELYHIFANTTHHASWGVAKECYSVQDLLGEEFQFQDKESRMLRANRPPGAAEPEAGTH
jgi:hypothetical protein